MSNNDFGPGRGGLLPLKKDPRDDKFSKIAFAAPALPVFPQTYRLEELFPVKNQTSSLSCTKQTTAAVSEYQDGVELSPAWGWAQVCKKVGNYIPAGAEPRVAMGITCELGELPQREILKRALYSFEQHDPQTIGNWNNWPDLRDAAEPYRKAAYIKVRKVGDWFDSIRFALWDGREQKQAVMAFGTWLSNWNGGWIPLEEAALVGYHAYAFVGWTHKDGTPYLIAKNSYGSEWGDGGFQYFPREVINREFLKWGTGLYVFRDLTPEQIAEAKKETPMGKLWRAVISLWYQFSFIVGRI